MEPDDLITIDEACALVNKTRETMRRAVRDGRLVRVRITNPGKYAPWYRVRRADVLALWPPREPPRCAVCGKSVTPGSERCRRHAANTPLGWLTIREAAAVLGCTFQNVNQLMRYGSLPDLLPETVKAYKAGRRWRRFQPGGGKGGRPRRKPEPWQLWDGT